MSNVNAKSVVTEAQNKKHLKAIAELLKVCLFAGGGTLTEAHAGQAACTVAIPNSEKSGN